jgi:hypothetical protein
MSICPPPQENLDKCLFLRELSAIKDVGTLAWLVLGHFNLIYADQDKSNGRVDMRMMTHFHRALNHVEVREIPLVGKCFTWSNDHNSPTMSRIDHAFCTTQCESCHLDPIMHPLSSSVSDHCPSLLHPQEQVKHPHTFRFEAHWSIMLGYDDCVTKAWPALIQSSQNAMMNLHIKLARTAKALSGWAKQLVPLSKLTTVIC